MKTIGDSSGFASNPITIQTSTKNTSTMEDAKVDYSNTTITNLTPNTSYNINGTVYVSDGDGVIATTQDQSIDALFTTDKGNLLNNLTIYKTETDDYMASDSITITKNSTQAAAPDLSGLTFSSTPTTGGKVSVSGFTVGDEYSTDGSTWTSITSTTLTLDPDMTIYVRHTGGVNTPSGLKADYLVASIPSTPSGSIDYTNNQITGLTPNATYYINSVEKTASSTGTIAITSSDYSENGTITVVKKHTSDTETDSVPQVISVSILEAPSNVEATSRTNSSITVTQVTGAEYSIDNGFTWQTSNTFTTDGNGDALQEGTQYTILTRMKRTTSAYESDSVSVSAYTRKTPTKDTGVTVNYIDQTLNGLTPNTTYMINGSEYTSDADGKIDISDLFDVETDTLTSDISFYKAETTDYIAGNAASPDQTTTITKITNAAAPSISGITAASDPDNGNVILSNLSSTEEYSINGSVYTKVVGTTLTVDPDAVVTFRIPATETAPFSKSVDYTAPSVEATSEGVVDYINSKITNLVPNATYTILGTTYTADADGKITIIVSLHGEELVVIKKGNGTTTLDSASQKIQTNSVSAPSTLSVVSKTDTSVTLNTITGAEYSIDGGQTWQDSNVFTGLSENTQYSFVARIKATTTCFESMSSEALNARTKSNQTIDSNISVDYVDQTLTGLTPNISYNINSGSYTSDETGKIDISDLFTDGVLTDDLTITKAATDELMESNAATIAKKDKGTAPSTSGISYDENPTEDGKVVINGLTSSIEYSLDGTTWVKGTRESIDVDGSSTIYIRTPASITDPISEVSTYAVPEVIQAPQSIVLSYTDEQLTGLTPNTAYLINGVTYTSDERGNIKLPSALFGETLNIQVKSTAATEINSTKTVIDTVKSTTPDAIQVVSKTDTSVTVTPITGGEYSIDNGVTWQDSNTFTGLTKETDYSVIARIKDTTTSFRSDETDPLAVKTKGVYVTPSDLTIDYTNLTLTGLTPNTTYMINGQEFTSDADGEINLGTLAPELFTDGALTSDLSIYIKGDANYMPSGSYDVDKITKSTAPSLSVAINPTSDDKVTVNGLDTNMEYSLDNGTTWTKSTSTSLAVNQNTSLLVRDYATSSKPYGKETKITTPSITSTPNPIISYKDGEFTSLDPDSTYIIDGTEYVSDETGKITIDDDLYGKTISIVKKGDGTSSINSLPKSIELKKTTAPSNVTVSSDPDTDGNVVIKGTDTTMEYSIDNGNTWTKCTGTSTSISSETPVLIRVASTDEDPHSDTISITSRKVLTTPDVDFDYSTKTISNLIANTDYVINGVTYTSDANGKITMSSYVEGKLTVAQKGDDTTTINSLPYTVNIDKSHTESDALSSKSDVEINLTSVTGASYSIDNGKTYQPSSTFTNLTENTPYTILIKTTTENGESYEVVSITTKTLSKENEDIIADAEAQIDEIVNNITDPSTAVTQIAEEAKTEITHIDLSGKTSSQVKSAVNKAVSSAQDRIDYQVYKEKIEKEINELNRDCQDKDIQDTINTYLATLDTYTYGEDGQGVADMDALYQTVSDKVDVIIEKAEATIQLKDSYNEIINNNDLSPEKKSEITDVLNAYTTKIQSVTSKGEANQFKSQAVDEMNKIVERVDVCFYHYISLAFLVLFFIFACLYTFLFKNYKLDLASLIVSACFLIESIVMSFFIRCNFCLVVNILSYVILILFLVYWMYLNKYWPHKDKEELAYVNSKETKQEETSAPKEEKVVKEDKVEDKKSEDKTEEKKSEEKKEVKPKSKKKAVKKSASTKKKVTSKKKTASKTAVNKPVKDKVAPKKASKPTKKKTETPKAKIAAPIKTPIVNTPEEVKPIHTYKPLTKEETHKAFMKMKGKKMKKLRKSHRVR